MSELAQIVNIVLPVFLVIGLGYALKRRGFLDEAVNSVLSRLVFYLAAPALLFRAAALTDLEEALELRSAGVVIAVSVAAAIFTYLAAARSSSARRGVLVQGAYRSNLVFVGLPVLTNALGSGREVMGSASVLIGIITPVYNFLAVVALTLPHRGEDGASGAWKRAGLDILKNPLIWSCVLGLLFSALELPLPGVADKSLKLVGDIAMPLALLVVGASLDFHRLRAELIPSLAVSAIKLLLYPGLVFVLLKMWGLSGLALQVPVLLIASPTAVVSHIMAREMKGDEQLAAAIVIGTTLASLFTISLWIAILI